jgi:hypothetical protein
MARVIVFPDCNSIVAHQPGVRGAVFSTANEKAAVARGILAAHRDQGHAQITVTRGSLDAFVNLTDTRGDVAAAAIEYGNRYGGGGIDVLGRAFGLT